MHRRHYPWRSLGVIVTPWGVIITRRHYPWRSLSPHQPQPLTALGDSHNLLASEGETLTRARVGAAELAAAASLPASSSSSSFPAEAGIAAAWVAFITAPTASAAVIVLFLLSHQLPKISRECPRFSLLLVVEVIYDLLPRFVRLEQNVLDHGFARKYLIDEVI
jgi:hypothetical protein